MSNYIIKHHAVIIKTAYVLLIVFFQKPTKSNSQQFVPVADLRFDNYNSQSGFVTNYTYRLIRSKKGHIWAAGNGIYRFDGKQYTHFSKLKNARGLRDNYTPWLQEDGHGRIWVGGNLGICYYDDHTDTFNYIDIDKKRPIQYSAGLRVLGPDVWFVCNYGLCKINTASLKVTSTSLKHVFECISLFAIDRNTLWIGNKTGEYYVYHIREDRYETKRLSASWNAVWNGTRNNSRTWLAASYGIWMAKNDTAQPEIVKGTEGMHPSDLSFVPALTGDSILWITTTTRGLQLFNIRTHKVAYAYMPDADNPYSIPAEQINAIYPDKDHIVWLTTETGISAVNYRNQYFKTRHLNVKVVSRMAQDSANKNIVWLAGYQHGLSKIDWRTKRVLRNYYNFKSIPYSPNEGSSIMNMYQADDVNWIFSSFGEIFTWNSKTGVEKKFSLVPARYFINYKKDAFFIVSSDSVYECQLPSCTLKPHCAVSGANDGVYDGKRYLWLPTGHGLVRYNTADGSKKTFLPDTSADNNGRNWMLKAVIDKRGRIICGTRYGLTVLDTGTEKFRFYGSFGAIRHPSCFDIKLTDSIAYVNTDGGLIHLNLNTGASFIIELRDKNNFSDRPIGTVNDELILGLRNEYTYFTPIHILNQPIPSAPLIEKVKANGRFYYYPVNRQSLSLQHDQNEISFYFTAFEYKDPEHILFRYKVDGLDTGWNYTSDLRKVDYMRLLPGEYNFIVQAGNLKGTWNDARSELFFIVVPPYWQAWWFRLGALVFFIAIVVSLAMWRIRSIKKREAERSNASIAIAEMELKALRSQMNPHFIFNSLNSIQKFIWDNKQEDAAEYLGKFSKLIRMILDHSMHKWITLEQEIATLSLYLELEHRRCNNRFDYFINIDSSLDTSSILFPPLVLQPYVENAIWHGLLNKEERGQLRITITKEDDSLIQCVIEDNGIGRSAAGKLGERNESKAVSYGTGITGQRLNMITEGGKKGAARIEDLHDVFENAAGTRVVISIPVSAFVKI